jgi:hypothetical protein
VRDAVARVNGVITVIAARVFNSDTVLSAASRGSSANRAAGPYSLLPVYSAIAFAVMISPAPAPLVGRHPLTIHYRQGSRSNGVGSCAVRPPRAAAACMSRGRRPSTVYTQLFSTPLSPRTPARSRSKETSEFVYLRLRVSGKITTNNYVCRAATNVFCRGPNRLGGPYTTNARAIRSRANDCLDNLRSGSREQ